MQCWTVAGVKEDAGKTHSSSVTNGYLPGQDVFNILSCYSHRPHVKDDFAYSRNGKSALRLATWNLGHLTLAKVGNPGVRETICRTILENR
ncbi:hypothetical protein PR048_018808 [Dryococelus australis]|uniref:Uncharacterized protein n=1 Tax=Dryococelus australis TaxID=614101 RepID=A0ABQ9H1T4_9NEOP|nr:hypothetical protein PR048_018808 [Dryococelus australis]